MPKDERNLLEVLELELCFLHEGGYGRLLRAPWRAPLIFEDSLTCLNYDARGNRAPCSECLLMEFVPSEHGTEKIPCRHIPLDADGQTLKMLYACGTQQEIEEALEIWLKTTIHRMEQDRVKAESASAQCHAVAI